MKVVVQRVKRASVRVGDVLISEIDRGLCLLVGISTKDNLDSIKQMARQVVKLRLFSNDEQKRWQYGIKDDTSLAILAISQFTLLARTDKGSKPDFHCAMPGSEAQTLFDSFVDELGLLLGEDGRVKKGAFGEYMQVEIVNDGPVTIVLE